MEKCTLQKNCEKMILIKLPWKNLKIRVITKTLICIWEMKRILKQHLSLRSVHICNRTFKTLIVKVHLMSLLFETATLIRNGLGGLLICKVVLLMWGEGTQLFLQGQDILNGKLRDPQE